MVQNFRLNENCVFVDNKGAELLVCAENSPILKSADEVYFSLFFNLAMCKQLRDWLDNIIKENEK